MGSQFSGVFLHQKNPSRLYLIAFCLWNQSHYQNASKCSILGFIFFIYTGFFALATREFLLKNSRNRKQSIIWAFCDKYHWKNEENYNFLHFSIWWWNKWDWLILLHHVQLQRDIRWPDLKFFTNVSLSVLRKSVIDRASEVLFSQIWIFCLFSLVLKHFCKRWHVAVIQLLVAHVHLSLFWGCFPIFVEDVLLFW